ERSMRCVALEQAAAIARTVPAFVTVVALFVNATPEKIRTALKRVPVHLLQFHGSETPEQCRVYDLPYMKAVRMQDGVDVHAQARAYDDACALLLDTHVDGIVGGSGQRFDWMRVPHDLIKPIVLAGGLTPENVAEAI